MSLAADAPAPAQRSFLGAFVRAFWAPVAALAAAAALRWLVAELQVGPRFAASHDLALRVIETLIWVSGIHVSIAFGRFVLYERVLLRVARLKAPKLVDQAGATAAYVVFGAMMLTHVWGVPLGSLLATSGVVGLVLGFALKNVLSDYLSGIALNLEAPFRLNDFVVLRPRGLPPVAGLVQQVSWRSTTVLTPEKKLVLVPNSVVAESSIENGSDPSPVTEFELEIVLDWAVGADLFERLLGAAVTEAWMAGATAGDAPATVRIRRLDGRGIVFKITYLIDPLSISKGRARHALLSAVHKHLRAAGLHPVSEAGQAPQMPRDDDRPEDRVVLLDEVPLLRVLTHDERAALARRLSVVRPCEGEDVVRAGQAGTSMFLVAEGLLEVKVAPPGGEAPVRVATLAPGDFFGEMSLLTGEARRATVTPVLPCVLYEISRDAFVEMGPAHGVPVCVVGRRVAQASAAA